jgi:hypothetical protein
MLTLCWLVPLATVAVVTGHLAGGPQKPLTPKEAMRPSNGAAVTVELQVLAVHTYTATTLALNFRADRNEQEDQFVVVLSEKAQEQLKRVGIHDLSRHFRGKHVRVTGPVTADWFTGLNVTGTYYKLLVEDVNQFEKVD